MLHILFFVVVVGGGFLRRVSLCNSSGCPGTDFVDQADLELRDPPASASQVLGLKACATTQQMLILNPGNQEAEMVGLLNIWDQPGLQ